MTQHNDWLRRVALVLILGAVHDAAPEGSCLERRGVCDR